MAKVITMRRPGEPSQPAEQPTKGTAHGGRPGLPISPVIEEYLYTARLRLGRRTYKNYASCLRAFARWADERKTGLEFINRRVVDEWAEHLEHTRQNTHRNGPITKRTQSNYVRMVKLFLYATKADSVVYGEYLSVDVIAGIKGPKYDETLVMAFSDEQIKELLKACQQERTEELRVRNQALIYLLSNTGIRAAECVGLKISDLTLEPDRGSVKVMGKGRRERVVYFGELTRRKLERYLEVCRAGASADEALFISYSRPAWGRPLTTTGLGQAIEALGKRTNITGIRISPHTFRHYYASSQIRRGTSLYDLKLCLGHKSVSMTEKYCRSLACDESLRERIAAALR